MNRNTISFNLLLLLGCLFLIRQVAQDFRGFRSQIDSLRMPESKEMEIDGKPSKPFQTSPQLAAPSYQHVFLKNLFLESRNLVPSQEVAAVEEAPPLNPKPILIGTTRVGTQQRATIRRPQTSPGKQGGMLILRLGDLYEGYKVTGINEKQVELTFTSAGGQAVNQFLMFADPATRAAAGPTAAITPIAPTQLIQVGATGGGSAVAATPVASNSAPPNPGASAQAASAPAASALPIPSAAERSSEGSRARTPTRRNEYLDSQGRRVIRTPFGDVVRPTEKPPQ